MKAKLKAPDIGGLRLFDSCVTLGRAVIAGVKVARLMMGVAPPLHWLWKDLCEVLEEHRIPCFLDFAPGGHSWPHGTTQGNPDNLAVDHLRTICLAHPDLPLILSHVSGGLGIAYAVLPLMRRVANLHLDITNIIDYWRRAATQIGRPRPSAGSSNEWKASDPTPEERTMKLRCGVVGLGRGRQFVQSLAAIEDCEVTAVCDPNPGTFAGLTGLSTHTKYEEFLEEELDVVAVASPGPAHAQQSLAALGRSDLDAMLREFVESIRRDTKPPIDVHESMDMTLPGIIAHQSGMQGGLRLEVPDSRQW